MTNRDDMKDDFNMFEAICRFTAVGSAICMAIALVIMAVLP